MQRLHLDLQPALHQFCQQIGLLMDQPRGMVQQWQVELDTLRI